MWQLVINPCCNLAIGSMDRSRSGSVNLMETYIGRLMILSHNVRVEAAGEGAAFHSFIEKARTFIPKSSYLRIRFFDVSGLCFSVPGWCILGLSNPLAFGMVLGGPFRLAPLLGSFVCQRKPLGGAQGFCKIGHTMEGFRGLLWASAGC